METFWTSKIPIHGLRHFVLVNNTREKGKDIFLMVSVVDCDINLLITYKELTNRTNWQRGWLDIPKNQSITEDYIEYKSLNENRENNKIFISDNSLFNIL